MPSLGNYLKHLREQSARSRRWVEKHSRELHPHEKERQISHSYLRQLEEGTQDRPSPIKLHTLAEIYGVDYHQLMATAGYLEAGAALPAVPETAGELGEPSGALKAKLEAAQRLIDFLERRGIHALYFVNSVMGLTEESLHLVNRLITTLAVKERRQDQQTPSRIQDADDGPAR